MKSSSIGEKTNRPVSFLGRGIRAMIVAVVRVDHAKSTKDSRIADEHDDSE